MGAGQSREERELAAELAAGGARAIERFYAAHVDALYGYVFYRVGRDRALAEDVVQDTFLVALDRIASFDAERGSLGAWLCTLSRNVIRGYVRTHRKLETSSIEWERIDRAIARSLEQIEDAPLADEIVERAETRDLVCMAIANLPENYREVLERKYVSGEKLDELAQGLGQSEEAVKSSLARARRAFRVVLATLVQEVSG